MGQNKKKKGFTLNKESDTINVSVEKLWEIAGKQFADAYKWSTSVDHSSGSGTAQFEGATCDARSCDLNAKGFNKVDEKLTNYDDEKMNLAYDVVGGLPGFVDKVSNNWTVLSVGENQSKIVMVMTFEVSGIMGTLMKGMMKKQIEKLINMVMIDLKIYAETGHPSDAKQKRIDELAKEMVD
ncbi:SRPBCC family protein [Winogradskyella sp. UBA3174]|uniref:SRPBCC family protein n=1 Tax=Winogradskyella sp. UBA3174 TaxID=1947785 RepID=UPI0025D5D104|nr:SRPBCC family protein [Winogradskyella sp. UBA3174]|tara:strand:- start:4874 stop:5419 length:546 start_codon:yes stop_codon:yes gene_type:complete